VSQSEPRGIPLIHALVLHTAAVGAGCSASGQACPAMASLSASEDVVLRSLHVGQIDGAAIVDGAGVDEASRMRR